MPYNENYWYLFGNAYDFSNFSHPAGSSSINIGKGKDATFLLISYHPKNIRTMLKRLNKYKLDQYNCDPDEKYSNQVKIERILDDPLRKDLIGCYKQYMADHKLSDTGISCFDITWVIANYCMFLTCAYFWFTRGSIVICVLMTLFHFNTAWQTHDSCHYSMTRNMFLNCLCQWMTVPYNYEAMCWHLQHNYSHHLHTNDIDKDMDLHHGNNPVTLYRIYSHEKYRNRFPFTYLIFIFIQLSMSAMYESVIYPLDRLFGRYGFGFIESDIALTGRFHPFERIRMMASISISLLFLVAPMLHPDATHRSISHNYMLCMLPFHITSIMFTVITQCSHVHFKTLEAGNDPNLTFYQKQILSSIDYSTKSRWVTRLTGGINMQSLHHAMPFVHSSHFVDLYPYYIQVCLKHKVIPPLQKSLWSTYFSYFLYLYKMNSTDRIFVE